MMLKKRSIQYIEHIEPIKTYRTYKEKKADYKKNHKKNRTASSYR